MISSSSTLVTLTFFWIIYCLYNNGNHKLIILILFSIFFTFTLVSDFEILKSSAFGSRLVGVLFERSETNNISSLVYMQGWDDAITNIIRTNGIGLGFNMMGCDPLPLVGYRDTLINLDPELVGLNAQDGSFLVSKFISEFGVIGILIIILTIFSYSLILYKSQKTPGTKK